MSGAIAGDVDALARCGQELRHVYEDVGFWFMIGHGVPQSLVERVFVEAARFHAQPPEDKLKLKINEHNIGYLAMRGPRFASCRSTLSRSTWHRTTSRRLSASPNIPCACRTTPMCACAGGLRVRPVTARRHLVHDPAGAKQGAGPVGAHRVETLYHAPVIARALLVNSGKMLNRWSNGRFRATPHRVFNRSGGERYVIPLFFDCTIDHEMVCLPSCTDADHPPKYEPPQRS